MCGESFVLGILLLREHVICMIKNRFRTRRSIKNDISVLSSELFQLEWTLQISVISFSALLLVCQNAIYTATTWNLNIVQVHVMSGLDLKPQLLSSSSSCQLRLDSLLLLYNRIENINFYLWYLGENEYIDLKIL